MTMDGNKDDALKSLKIGADAMQSGDRTRALKFIMEARRMYPSLTVDDLLQSLNYFTEEQATIVRDINRKKDYYEILSLDKTCSVDDIRKSYKKLSLKVHPDKNNAPGAEEAFKLVCNAFQCLSDVEKRKSYDRNHSNKPRSARPTPTHGGGGGGGDRNHSNKPRSARPTPTHGGGGGGGDRNHSNKPRSARPTPTHGGGGGREGDLLESLGALVAAFLLLGGWCFLGHYFGFTDELGYPRVGKKFDKN